MLLNVTQSMQLGTMYATSCSLLFVLLGLNFGLRSPCRLLLTLRYPNCIFPKGKSSGT